MKPGATPPSRRRQIVDHYTAFKSFPRRSHFLMAEPGWEEVADYAIKWATEHARDRKPGTKTAAAA